MELVLPFKHFKKEEKSVYGKTFLTKISIKLFLPDGFIWPPRESLNVFFKDEFGIEITDLQYDKLQTSKLTIKTETGAVSMSLSRTDIKIVIDRLVYTSFRYTLIPLLEEILSKLPWIDRVTGFKIRKVNIWSVSSEDPVTEDQVGNLLNAVVVEDLKEKGSVIGDRVYMYSIVNSETREQASEILDICYGLVLQGDGEEPVDGKYFGGVVLDNAITVKREFDVAQVIEEAENANDYLYDAFHWAVKPDVISLMK